MGLIGINPVQRDERKPSTLEQIALGVDMATKILNTGANIYSAVKPKEESPIDQLIKAMTVEKGRQELSKPVLTPGQESVDRKFADEYVDFNAAGGYSGIKNSLDQLNTAKQKLEHSQSISGPWIGAIPEEARKRSNPESAAVQRDIENSINDTLRATLGAQFTQQEGARILKQAFDPSLPEAENARRVEGVIQKLERIAKAKQQASEYYQDHGGTLKGYRGQTSFGRSDFGLKPGLASPSVAAPSGISKEDIQSEMKRRGLTQ